MSLISSSHSTLEFPASIQFMRPALTYVRELASSTGFEDTAPTMIELALEEVLSNIIQHGYKNRPDGRILLTCALTTVGFEICVLEQGLPFDFSAVPDYSGPDLEQGDATGLGLHLVRQVMDEVIFENLGRKGKQLRLLKFFPDHEGSSPAVTETSGFQSDQELPAAATDEMSVQVRDLLPEDAVELARCTYKAYGYGYDDYIYHPERTRQMLRDGLLSSAIGTTENGRIVGHAALKRRFANDPLLEVGALFVDPTCRGRNLAGRINRRLMSKLPELKALGAFARSVTNHLISQKAASSVGKDCGLLIGRQGYEGSMLDPEAQRRYRQTRVVTFAPLAERPPRSLYPAPRYRAWVERIYQSIELPVEFPDVPSADSLPPLDAPAALRATEAKSANVADIEVLAFGTETVASIRQTQRAYARTGVDVIFLHLDLEDPRTALIDAELEAMGFLFAGVLPYFLQGRDALTLQLVNLEPADLEGVQLLSPLSNELMDYVLSSLGGVARTKS